MKKQRLLKIVQPILSAESGRSMVEMLGVLTIIGVLSLAGVEGYKYAIAKYTANELLEEINLRVISIRTQMRNHEIRAGNNDFLREFPKTVLNNIRIENGSGGYDFFALYIYNVPKELCSPLQSLAPQIDGDIFIGCGNEMLTDIDCADWERKSNENRLSFEFEVN